MSNNITVTTELCAGDRKLLESLVGSVTLLASVLGNSLPQEVQEKIVAEVSPAEPVAETATAPQPAQKPETPDAGHPVDEVSPHGEPEPVAEPEPAPVTKWTKDDLTKKVQALAAPGTGKREKVRDIVKSYAPNVGAIPEDKYDEVMAKLTALEKED